MQQSKTGTAKFFIYAKIALHVLWRCRSRLSPGFVLRAARMLSAFYDNKVIRLNGKYKLHIYLPAYPTPAFFKAVENKLVSKPPRPVSMVWGITKACTYRCPHCYQRLDGGGDLGSEKILETLKNITDAGVCFLNIEGGDAFLRFGDLCEIMDALNDETEVWINTTGANVTREKLQILKSKGVCGLMVSMHSPYAEEHDAFVGCAGAFEAAKNTLAMCGEVGLGSAINTVLTYEDIRAGHLPKIMELANELKCGFVQLIHPKRAGRWLDNRELDGKDAEIRAYMEKAHRHYNALPGGPALPAQAQEEHPDKFGCTCGGIDRFYIGAGGEVQPCEFLNISFGNLKEEPFGIIFERMRAAFKVPCEEWLCETKAEKTAEYMRANNITATPLPRDHTLKLVENWKRGTPTRLYKKLGIYENE